MVIQGSSESVGLRRARVSSLCYLWTTYLLTYLLTTEDKKEVTLPSVSTVDCRFFSHTVTPFLYRFLPVCITVRCNSGVPFHLRYCNKYSTLKEVSESRQGYIFPSTINLSRSQLRKRPSYITFLSPVLVKPLNCPHPNFTIWYLKTDLSLSLFLSSLDCLTLPPSSSEVPLL